MPDAKKATKETTNTAAKKTATKKTATKKTATKKTATKKTKKASTHVAKKTAAKATKKAPAKIANEAARKASTQAAGSTKGRPAMANKPASIDDYLSHVEPETRKLLQALRQTILALVPAAEECISYSMPAFRWNGKVIGGFAATREGGSYYPFSGTTLDTLGEALAGYSRTKSGLHFTRESPLPRALVEKLLDARMAEVRG